MKQSCSTVASRNIPENFISFVTVVFGNGKHMHNVHARKTFGLLQPLVLRD
jgi:hypothetical protein